MTVSIVFAVLCVALAFGLCGLAWIAVVNRRRSLLRWSLGAAVVLALLAVSAVRDVALAQSPSPLGPGAPPLGATGRHGDGHAENHDAYRALSNPATGASCCNGTVDGVEGDCRPGTVWRDAGGDLRARIGGRELFVPESALVPGAMNPHPPVGMICERDGRFYCVALSDAGG